MKSAVSIAVCCVTILLGGFACAQEKAMVNHLSKSGDSTRTMQKWNVEQETNNDTVAVARLVHRVAGMTVDEFEEISCWPGHTELGSGSIEINEGRPKITLPSQNWTLFDVDEKWNSIGWDDCEIECVDAKKWKAVRLQAKSTYEVVTESFYLAPMEIFRKAVPEMPDPKVKAFAKFYVKRRGIDPVDFTIETSSAGGAKRVSVTANKIPTAATKEKGAGARDPGRPAK